MLQSMFGRRPRNSAIILIFLTSLGLLLSGCYDFDNPVDPASESYQGYKEERSEGFTLLYDANGADGGSVPVDGTLYREGDTVNLALNSGALTLSGNSFIGWNTAQDGSGTHYIAGGTLTMPGDDLILYAEWTALPTYMVTYDADGGINPPADANNYLETASVTVLGPGSMSRAGFQFMGWGLSPGGGVVYNPSDTFPMPASSVTLVAQWEPVYTVTYDGNTNDGGAVPVDANTYYNGQMVTVLDNSGGLTKMGYTFTGWSLSPGGPVDYVATDTFAMPAGPVTLYAQWVALPTYAVTYNGNTNDGGAVPVDANTYYNGQTVTVLDNSGGLTKMGYTFNGWGLSPGGPVDYVATDTFAMPAGPVTLYAQWSSVFAGGDGSLGTPFLISTPNELNNLRLFPNAHYELTADIDMNISPYNSGSGWDPIDATFNGSINGNGHIISNLYINTNATWAGFLGDVEGTLDLSNLHLSNVNINSTANIVGGLVGYTDSLSTVTIDNCSVTGTISGGDSVGGLVGYDTQSITNSYADVDVTASGIRAGGLVGYSRGDISNSYSLGTVSGTDNVGGLVGYQLSSLIENSYSQADVSGGMNVGGFTGYLDSGTIRNSYAIGNVNGSDAVGGLVGNSADTVNESYAAGVVGVATNSGGLVGINSGTVNNSYYDSVATGQSDNSGKGTPLSSAQILQQAQFGGYDFATVWQIDENISYPYLQWQGGLNQPLPVRWLSARYEFTAGSEIIDSGGKGNDLTPLGGAPTYELLDTRRHVRLNSTTDLLSSGTSVSLDTLDGGQSVSFWYYGNTLSIGRLVGRFDGTTRSWVLGMNFSAPSQLNILDNGGYLGGGVVDFSTGLNAGVWNHIVVTFDTTLAQAKVYINNGVASTYSLITTPFLTPGEILIGDPPGTASSQAAMIDARIADLRIYNFPISTQQVNAIFIE